MILVSKKIGDTIRCGCSVKCHDRFGDVLQIVTSGIFACGCIEISPEPTPQSTRLLLDGDPNGGFDANWNGFVWNAVLSTGTIRSYLSSTDCTGDFGTAATSVDINVACDTGTGALTLSSPILPILIENAQFNTAYPIGPCGDGAFAGGGFVTILNPES